MRFQRFDWLSGHGISHGREIATINLSSGCLAKRNQQDLSTFLDDLFHSRLLDMR